jgi:hypothetical protein
MSQSVRSPEQWTPASEADRELVLRELEAMLTSHHFRGSKRYPALLKYVVDAALDGHSGDLKERTLGVEVFGRHPNYDTSADPVVRFSAGEVRKRIAQYYHENGNGSRLQIELPIGSYVPEFQLRASESQRMKAVSQFGRLSGAQGNATENRRHFHIALWSLVAMLLFAGGVFGAYKYRRTSVASVTPSDKLWAPFLNSTRSVLIVVGTSHPAKLKPETEETSFIDHMTGPYHHVSVASAIALAHLAGVLQEHGRTYEIKEDTEASLTDIRSRPLILVGATNNSWTMHLVGSLRFRFIKGPMAQIEDAKNPANYDWIVDFSKPYSSVSTDYAIVARFHDATTEGPVMVIAGLGPYGTQAASELVDSPQYLAAIARQLPAGWENKNLEMVLKSDVIGGKPGPPILASSTVW